MIDHGRPVQILDGGAAQAMGVPRDKHTYPSDMKTGCPCGTARFFASPSPSAHRLHLNHD